MFRRRTLFVVGAGASEEVGLPLGGALAAQIGKKMDIRFEHINRPIGSGDMDIYLQLTQQMQRHLQEYQRAGWLIRDGIVLARSIGDFLDVHRNAPFVVRYGKTAIVKSILVAEQKSKLFFERDGEHQFEPARIADTWFVKFMQMLGRGIPKENVAEIFENVAFVVFNYDRCIEYFLINALQKLYGISEQDSRGIVDDLTIIHPYGVVAPTIQFGSVGANHAQLAEGIKTYTEQIAAGDVIAAIATEVTKAECLIFLGFAYHEQNMLLLKPEPAVPHKFVFGTAFGMSDSDVEVVKHQIAGFFSPNMTSRLRDARIKIENKMKAADLFDNYARSLTGGD